MKNLTKPLGVHGKKAPFEIKGGISSLWGNIPFFGMSVGIVSAVLLGMIIWVAAVDDPKGGEPIVNARILEPKFDSKDRDVGIVAVQNGPVLEALDIEDQAQLSELVADEQPTAIDPNEILIYDPTAAPKSTGRISLSTVAENNLIEKSRYGFLPKIGVNGEKSVRAYSRPAGIVSGRKNQIAIIIGGLGLNETTTQSVLTDLPAETTLAFAPYANGLFDWMAQARGRGHELLIQLPLEPFDYPNNDPGPKTLLVDDIWDANVDRLHWLLSRMTNYVGVVNYLGARYSASPEALRPLFNELRSRGLLYVDDGSTPLSRSSEVADELNVPFAQSSLVLDTLLTAEDIDAQLLELESLAREKGIAIGVASAFPITVKRLKRWAEGAERRGIKLIPISATLNKSSF
ncbi:MAG: divergent polysaccharide deacetylase family protein [Hyphomicrobiales bacterium]